MLRSLNDLLIFVLLAEDGEIGTCRDFLIEGEGWRVPYMIADTGTWFSRSRVLIPTSIVDDPDWSARRLPVRWSREQVKKSPTVRSKDSEAGDREETLRRHSLLELTGTRIRALDGEIGHVSELLMDEPWTVRYLVADTGVWLPGKRVCISVQCATVPDASEQVEVRLTREQIENGPEHQPVIPMDREYQVVLHDYYGWPRYWE